MSDNKIAIYGSRSKSQNLEGIEKFLTFLTENGFRVFLQQRFAEYLEERNIKTGEGVPVQALPPGTGLAISIGGDGTFLRTAAWVGPREIPIVGINTGHLGYLSAGGLDEATEIVKEICSGDIKVEKRMVLEILSEDLPKSFYPYALNEVTISRDDSASVVTVRTMIDGYDLADYGGDGLIISTPTGSTAYNLSAGGPVIEPTVDCIAVTPIAPHTLSLRPMVVAGSSEFTLRGESRTGKLRLTLDDRSTVIRSGTDIKIRRATFGVMVVRRKNSDFAQILRDKLLWNAR